VVSVIMDYSNHIYDSNLLKNHGRLGAGVCDFFRSRSGTEVSFFWQKSERNGTDPECNFKISEISNF